MDTQDWKSVEPSKPGAFVKGHDPRRQPGGIDQKTRKVRKQLAKLDGKAMALLERMMTSEDPDQNTEALKLWAKYRLPVPTEKTAVDLSIKTPGLKPELAAKLAALEVQ